MADTQRVMICVDGSSVMQTDVPAAKVAALVEACRGHIQEAAPAPEYPKMLYHGSERPVVVSSAEEEAALGPDWHALPEDAGVVAVHDGRDAHGIVMVPIASSEPAPTEAPAAE